jgi:hypothetical protein
MVLYSVISNNGTPFTFSDSPGKAFPVHTHAFRRHSKPDGPLTVPYRAAFVLCHRRESNDTSRSH